MPWTALLALIEPAYPRAGRGRPPFALETMLRIHLMQNWFGFSDPAMEEALYENCTGAAVRALVVDARDPGRDDAVELPASAGSERFGAENFAGSERRSVPHGTDVEARHDGGCHGHRGAEIDQERGRRA